LPRQLVCYTDHMEHFRRTWHTIPKSARRVIVLIAGGACIIAGIFMLVLPGPGWATIFLGLAIMATEFEWAERARAGIIKRFKNLIDKARQPKKR
jgi:uncharacterized protein (TIGR02611 family)